jgi:hypothetical protein
MEPPGSHFAQPRTSGNSAAWVEQADELALACAEAGIRPIVGGCTLMFLEPVDIGHRCMHWWLARRHLVPA